VKRHIGSSERRGVAVVELAFLLPVLLTLLVGMWDLGQLVRGLQVLSIAARDAGRTAASGTKTATQIGNAVTLMVSQNGVPASDVVFTYANATNPGVDPTAATQGDILNITIAIPFTSLKLASGTSMGQFIKWRHSGNVSFQSQWASMRDLPVVIDTTIPKE
jgi:Flp pilus assembly protein TadG